MNMDREWLAGLRARLARAEALMPQRGPEASRRRELAARVLAGDGDAAVSLADALGVDPRWLATGARSRASYAAVLSILRLAASARFAKSMARNDALLRHVELQLEMLSEPPIVCGGCRYCFRREEIAIDGYVRWADRQRTICSDCLRPLEAPSNGVSVLEVLR